MDLSFLIICYKQENYIAAALESALAQKGEPIEIVVSDDNSPDRTFEIARKIATAYHGPHQIILNRNPVNLGIGGNFQKAAEIAHGEWLLMAAGDDISLPERAEITRSAIARHPGALGFGAPREFIDQWGRSLGYTDWHVLIHGASAAWHRRLFFDFPPMGAEIGSEDVLLYFRIFLLNGQAVTLNQPVLRYRNDGLTNSCGESYQKSIPHSLLKAEIFEKILHVRIRECGISTLPIPQETRLQLQQIQQERLAKLQLKLDKLRKKTLWIGMGLFGFWRSFFSFEKENRPPLWRFFSFSLLFFKNRAEKNI